MSWVTVTMVVCRVRMRLCSSSKIMLPVSASAGCTRAMSMAGMALPS
jgi:hypothetical protein